MNEAPLRAAMRNRRAQVTRMLINAGADGTKVKEDLRVLCDAAALGDNGYRSMVFNDAKEAALEECTYAAAVLGGIGTNDADQNGGLQPCMAQLQANVAALQAEMQNGAVGGQGKGRFGPCSAAMIQRVNTAQKAASQNKTKFEQHKTAHANLVAEIVLSPLALALPKAQMEMARFRCERRVHELYHHSSALDDAFEATLTELAKKKEALDVAFILICESDVYANQDAVDALLVAVSHLFDPEAYTEQLSVLYSAYDLSVQRAMKLGIPLKLLLNCIDDRRKLPGTGLTGKWAWCLLRRIFLGAPWPMARYVEISLRPGNSGFAEAMQSFYQTTSIADSAI